MAAPDDLEARVSALEASQADYRAVLSAVNTLGANQRDHSLRMDTMDTRLTRVETEPADFRTETRARFSSVDDQLAEIKDLIVRKLP
jgi:hypothetical protein